MSRHVKRAAGQTSITFQLHESLKAELVRLAEEDERSLSKFCEMKLWEIVSDKARKPAKSSAAARPLSVTAGPLYETG